MNRCGGFPLLSTPHSLSLASEQTIKDLKRAQGHHRGGRRVDLANWALWTSPKFTTGVKYRFHQGSWPDQRSGNSNQPSPPYPIQCTKFISKFLWSEMQSIILRLCVWRMRKTHLKLKMCWFFGVQYILMLTYRSLTIYFVIKYYER